MRPGIVWALLILILCTVNTPDIYIPPVWDLFTFDKVVHFIFYSILIILFYRGLDKLNADRRYYQLFFIACVLYGGFIEVIQATCFPNRSGDVPDFIANTIGCIIGVLVFAGYQRARQRA